MLSDAEHLSPLRCFNLTTNGDTQNFMNTFENMGHNLLTSSK